ncbi:hypothetical protein QQS21_006421 [Conoideocrella luteorostrata]|uniref:Zn(2)-C6 fungal-type domain-containing protein n=1 Tax=Conoideocrella luteorostrata TaxID=1105319 RepID=A0AAJ0CML1_9HYPO|nr:hypothetical protein QQS21_006421 [Conoideocrella luteorostrata]
MFAPVGTKKLGYDSTSHQSEAVDAKQTVGILSSRKVVSPANVFWQQCHRCSRMKRHCDGAVPKCGQCESHGMSCRYPDRAAYQLLDRKHDPSLISAELITSTAEQRLLLSHRLPIDPVAELPLTINTAPPLDTTTDKPIPTPRDISEEPAVKFIGSYTPLAAPSVKVPPLHYDFASAGTPPVLRPKVESSPPLHGTLTSTPENEYQYLEIPPNRVRLLLLSKGESSDSIHCSLKTLDSQELSKKCIVYQALSYAWGPGEDLRHSIFLRDLILPKSQSDNLENGFLPLVAHQLIPRRFHVRPSLYLALMQLRSKTDDLWFWVDAICINQADNKEKTHQLSKMLEIYRNANNVCIWIGEDVAARDSNQAGGTAMQFVPRIINLTEFERIISSKKMDEEVAHGCCAFAAMLKSPWFGRRWVIQEVSAACHASIQYGRHRINWIDFADAVDLFTASIDRIRSTFKNTEAFKSNPDALRHIESTGARAIVCSTNEVLRKAANGMIVERPLDIESLVMKFVHFDTSDPRDTIYALLALARGSSPSLQSPSLRPDYSSPPLQTYMEFVRYCVITGGSLDIVCRHWALPLKNFPFRWTWRDSSRGDKASVLGRILPTWIGLASNSAFGPPSRFTGRLNGDSLVGSPGKAVYNACRGSHLDVRFGEELVEQTAAVAGTKMNGSMSAMGMAIGVVSKATSRVVDGIISDDCLELLGWQQDDDVNTIPDQLWRTMVGNRNHEGQPPPRWYRRACMYCLRMTTAEGDLNIMKLVEASQLPNTVLHFLRRVQAVVWSRKFLTCQNLRANGSPFIGLGPRYAKEGDLLCILFGCSVPVLLRRLDQSPKYGLVGECYIHGIMDGEIMTILGERGVQDATALFEIH